MAHRNQVMDSERESFVGKISNNTLRNGYEFYGGSGGKKFWKLNRKKLPFLVRETIKNSQGSYRLKE